MDDILKKIVFNDKRISVIFNEKNIYFKANSLCDFLDIKNKNQLINRLLENEKKYFEIKTVGGKQKTLFISESGFYKLVFSSNKKEAVDFQNYVCEEILPQIRKTGMYFDRSKLVKYSQIKNVIGIKKSEIYENAKKIFPSISEKIFLADYFKTECFFTPIEALILAFSSTRKKLPLSTIKAFIPEIENDTIEAFNQFKKTNYKISLHSDDKNNFFELHKKMREKNIPYYFIPENHNIELFYFESELDLKNFIDETKNFMQFFYN